MSDDPANMAPPSSSSSERRREHARRDAMQEDLLRRAYQRSVHRNYIEAALRRSGHTVLSRESVNGPSLRIRPTD